MRTFKIIFIYTLCQILIAWWLGYYIYQNYNKITANESWVSNKQYFSLTVTDPITITSERQQLDLQNNEEEIYNWSFWSIIYKKEINLSDTLDLESLSYTYNLNYEKINLIKRYIILSENWLLDKYLYNKIQSLSENKRLALLQDVINLQILLNDWKKDFSNVLANYSYDASNEIKALIRDRKVTELRDYLYRLDETYKQTIWSLPDNLLANNEIITDWRFQYILKMINTWELSSRIDDIWSRLWIDPLLIKSVIGVEQLRFMTTQRGKLKDAITQNLPLINFSKFSFWLAWIKVETFRSINQDLQSYVPQIYNKYFKSYSEEWYNDTQIIRILRDDISWIYYIWWLLLTSQEKWKEWWVDISNRPDIITTIYNMWNKKAPRQNPESWWSLLDVFDKPIYFWDLGAIYYYYLKLYWDWLKEIIE